MWHNTMPINMTRNKMCSFVTGSVIDKSISIGMKHIIVESNFIQKTLSVTSATTLQLEADHREVEAHVVKLGSHVVGFVDSFDRFRLQFSHALTIAPCTTSAREKSKKVCQAEKNNFRIGLELARFLPEQDVCQVELQSGG
jgi:hypothetical protein